MPQSAPHNQKTIKLSDSPQRGPETAMSGNKAASVEETLARPHTLKGRPSALCECKSLRGFSVYVATTSNMSKMQLPFPLGARTDLVLPGADDTVTEDVHIYTD